MTPITRPIRRAAQTMGVEAQLLADCLHDCPRAAVARVSRKRGADAEQALLSLLKAAHPVPAEGLGLATKTRERTQW